MRRLSRLFRLLAEAMSASLRMLCVSAPRFVVAAVAPFVALATVVWAVNQWAGTPWSHLTTGILFSCYALAGLILGALSACRRVVFAGLDWLEQTSPRLLDAIVDPLIQRTPAAGKEVCIADLRNSWTAATAALVIPNPPEAGALSSLSRIVNWIARRSMRARTAALEQFLSDLEQQGDTHISPESLKRYLQDKLLLLARGDARGKLAVLQCCGYPLALLVASIPLILVTVRESIT